MGNIFSASSFQRMQLKSCDNVKHFALRVADRPGLPAAIASALWQKGVNIETFSAELHRGQGTFHLVVDKVAVAKETFMENGWEAAEENVTAQTLANKPGKAGSRRFLKVVR